MCFFNIVYQIWANYIFFSVNTHLHARLFGVKLLKKAIFHVQHKTHVQTLNWFAHPPQHRFINSFLTSI
uniref:Wsv511 n=1 Tax=White spot syndrome virus TaxID=92652 RepID=A0A2U9GE90_WSSV|nr:wsv511 [Shrimp white spot syndrome virus]AWQ62723.1 wsv511 [Shrimp white spot syndrome virus]AWQ63135.1 wsv511 [Shrimp white spot syndrome virus]AWQ63958.1 wsv511 [Shrimp white spot syndrome virus]